MLTLHTFGPHFGLPDGSPFCIKGLLLIKMADLPFEAKPMSFKQAPKGKAPYLVDGGVVIADSHFIMRHLESKHGADFSGGYDAGKLAQGLAISRMLEEHFYFLSMNIRWLKDENFWKGPIQFFKDVPAPIRPLIARMVRGKIRKTHYLQGLGRHTEAERLELAKEDLLVIENMLGKNKYVLGANLSAVDATAFAFVWAGSAKYFESAIGDYVRSRPILVAYMERMKAKFFPEFQNG